MEKYFSDIAIVGGGAAGIVCAVAAARRNKNKRIILIERNPSLGRKILVTGNGRCNLTNLNAASKYYSGSLAPFLDGLFSRYGAKEVMDFFGSLGLLCTVEADGRVYPLSRQASSVNAVLLNAVSSLNNIECICGCCVTNIAHSKKKFTVEAGNAVIIAEKLVIACGGKAYPKLGSDASVYPLLQKIGHKIKEPLPALCPLLSSDKGLKALAGARARARVTLLDGEKPVDSRSGELQFTAAAVSGICVFDLACKAQMLKNPVISAAFLPDYSKSELFALLKAHRTLFYNEYAEKLLTGVLNRALCADIIKYCKISPKLICAELTDSELSKIAAAINDRRFNITGAQGFDSAQVSSGGVEACELNCETFESNRIKGLYFCGEVLDINADCGGYNLQFAFASALKVGENL